MCKKYVEIVKNFLLKNVRKYDIMEINISLYIKLIRGVKNMGKSYKNRKIKILITSLLCGLAFTCVSVSAMEDSDSEEKKQESQLSNTNMENNDNEGVQQRWQWSNTNMEDNDDEGVQQGWQWSNINPNKIKNNDEEKSNTIKKENNKNLGNTDNLIKIDDKNDEEIQQLSKESRNKSNNTDTFSMIMKEQDNFEQASLAQKLFPQEYEVENETNTESNRERIIANLNYYFRMAQKFNEHENFITATEYVNKMKTTLKNEASHLDKITIEKYKSQIKDIEIKRFKDIIKKLKEYMATINKEIDCGRFTSYSFCSMSEFITEIKSLVDKGHYNIFEKIAKKLEEKLKKIIIESLEDLCNDIETYIEEKNIRFASSTLEILKKRLNICMPNTNDEKIKKIFKDINGKYEEKIRKLEKNIIKATIDKTLDEYFNEARKEIDNEKFGSIINITNAMNNYLENQTEYLNNADKEEFKEKIKEFNTNLEKYRDDKIIQKFDAACEKAYNQINGGNFDAAQNTITTIHNNKYEYIRYLSNEKKQNIIYIELEKLIEYHKKRKIAKNIIKRLKTTFEEAILLINSNNFGMLPHKIAVMENTLADNFEYLNGKEIHNYKRKILELNNILEIRNIEVENQKKKPN